MSWLVGTTAWALASLTLACGVASAFDPAELYQAKVLVTGQRDETRLPALQRGLEDVLIKVSGDPDIIHDADDFEPLSRAGTYVDSFRYRDLMAGIPVHDEQGTRDRPYELTVHFDPAKIDGIVRSRGRTPWTGERPRVAAFVAVDFEEVEYVLAADGNRGRDQRESLLAAAWTFGIPAVIPTQQLLAASGVTFENLGSAEPGRLETAAKTAGGDVGLVGTLTWSPEALGWVADWRLAWKGKPSRWQIRGVNFDDAFRSAMSGALRILSDHGPPP
jgi:hypothetical protein